MADDPKLIKIARALHAEQQRAKAEGKELSPEWADWFVGQQSGGSIARADVVKYLEGLQQQRRPGVTYGSKAYDAGQRSTPALRDVGRSVAQGALFNFADELIGLFKGEGAKEEMRLREEMSTATPREKTMAGLLGTAPLAAIPGGALMAGATTVPRAIATGAAVGGASGALAGAGAGETGAERAGGALAGGAMGAGFGAVLPALPATVRAFSPKVRAVRQLVKEVGEAGGADALRAKNMEYETLGRGNESRLADLAPETRDLADRAATASPRVREQITKISSTRQSGMAERMLADAEDEFDKLYGEVPNTIKRRGSLEASRRTWANEAYGQLREAYKEVPDVFATAPAGRSGPTLTKQGGELTKFFSQPRIKAIVKEARDLKLIGELPERTHKLSFEELQTIREQIRDAADAAFSATNPRGNLGRRLKEVDTELTKHMQARMPELKRVDAEYAKRIALENALDMGEKAWGKSSVRELEETIAKLPKDELQQFRYGMAAKYIDQLSDVRTNRDFASQILNASKTEQTKMKLALGPSYMRVIRMAQLEREMALLRGTTTGSATARRGASADAADDVMAAGTTGLSAGPQMATSMAARGVARGLRARANERTARALEPMLMTEGTDAIEAFLKKLRPPIVAGGTATKRLPIITSAELVGLLNERKR